MGTQQQAKDLDTNSDPDNEPAELSYVDANELSNYITRTVAVLVGQAEESLISESLSIASKPLTAFIKDQQSQIFVVNRLTQHDTHLTNRLFGIQLSMKCTTTKIKHWQLYLSKKDQQSFLTSRFASNLVLLCKLNNGDPYDSICGCIGGVLSPFFKSVVRGEDRDNQESDKLIPAIEKNLNDAEVALIHLKQNIEIPDVELTDELIEPNAKKARTEAMFNLELSATTRFPLNYQELTKLNCPSRARVYALVNSDELARAVTDKQMEECVYAIGYTHRMTPAARMEEYRYKEPIIGYNYQMKTIVLAEFTDDFLQFGPNTGIDAIVTEYGFTALKSKFNPKFFTAAGTKGAGVACIDQGLLNSLNVDHPVVKQCEQRLIQKLTEKRYVDERCECTGCGYLSSRACTQKHLSNNSCTVLNAIEFFSHHYNPQENTGYKFTAKCRLCDATRNSNRSQADANAGLRRHRCNSLVAEANLIEYNPLLSTATFNSKNSFEDREIAWHFTKLIGKLKQLSPNKIRRLRTFSASNDVRFNSLPTLKTLAGKVAQLYDIYYNVIPGTLRELDELRKNKKADEE
ncbi:Dynein heavy chain domain containing protein [Aphelenchoides bicaudatus]|nr:Dynein heavy chain domain containing protein [Aphelenchoides bicaudatus]